MTEHTRETQAARRGAAPEPIAEPADQIAPGCGEAPGRLQSSNQPRLSWQLRRPRRRCRRRPPRLPPALRSSAIYVLVRLTHWATPCSW